MDKGVSASLQGKLSDSTKPCGSLPAGHTAADHLALRFIIPESPWSWAIWTIRRKGVQPTARQRGSCRAAPIPAHCGSK